MADTQDTAPSWRDGAQLLLRDLACISGTLGEITTVWRRAMPYLAELPLILPVQLQDAARQLAADIRALPDNPAQSPDQALSAVARFSALQQSITSAQAITCGPGLPDLGDGRLWESLRALLHRAGTQLAALMPHPVAASR
jgi:hypothetical protein